MFRFSTWRNDFQNYKLVKQHELYGQFGNYELKSVFSWVSQLSDQFDSVLKAAKKLD